MGGNYFQIVVAKLEAVIIIRLRAEGLTRRLSGPRRLQMLFNKKMKTDVWALVGIVVTTIQTQQVTH